jgi:hypothetical protein
VMLSGIVASCSIKFIVNEKRAIMPLFVVLLLCGGR